MRFTEKYLQRCGLIQTYCLISERILLVLYSPTGNWDRSSTRLNYYFTACGEHAVFTCVSLCSFLQAFFSSCGTIFSITVDHSKRHVFCFFFLKALIMFIHSGRAFPPGDVLLLCRGCHGNVMVWTPCHKFVAFDNSRCLAEEFKTGVLLCVCLVQCAFSVFGCCRVSLWDVACKNNCKNSRLLSLTNGRHLHRNIVKCILVWKVALKISMLWEDLLKLERNTITWWSIMSVCVFTDTCIDCQSVCASDLFFSQSADYWQESARYPFSCLPVITGWEIVWLQSGQVSFAMPVCKPIWETIISLVLSLSLSLVRSLTFCLSSTPLNQHAVAFPLHRKPHKTLAGTELARPPFRAVVAMVTQHPFCKAWMKETIAVCEATNMASSFSAIQLEMHLKVSCFSAFIMFMMCLTIHVSIFK